MQHWLGCNALGHIDATAAASLIFSALDHGITCFDTADSYAGGASEEELGRLLPADRSGVTVATKFGHPSSVVSEAHPCSARHIEQAVDGSLRRLKCECIDVYLIHFPDRHTPYGETLDVLQKLIVSGKIGAYGVSNFRPEQLQELLAAAADLGLGAPAIIQEEYNLLHRQSASALIPLLRREHLRFVPFFPLASGLLTGKYLKAGSTTELRGRIVRNFSSRFMNDANFRKVAALQQLCERHKISMIAVALQWLLIQSEIAGLALGASNANQLLENLTALGQPIESEVLVEADILTK